MAISFKARPYGTGFIVYIGTTSGPSSYDATNGFSVTLPMKKIHDAIVVLNNVGNTQVKIDSISGNTIVLRFYTIAANTSTGEISATEVSNGTDLSALSIKIFAVGE